MFGGGRWTGMGNRQRALLAAAAALALCVWRGDGFAASPVRTALSSPRSPGAHASALRRRHGCVPAIDGRRAWGPRISEDWTTSGRRPPAGPAGQALMCTVARSGVQGGGASGAASAALGAARAAVLALLSVASSVQPSILLLATKAVMKLVVSCSVGFAFTKKGILDQAAITALSRLIFFVFQPCLLFVNVASTISAPGQNLSKLLVLPAFAALQIFIGSVVGKVMEKILRLPPGSPESRELRTCTSFANSGPLPLLFVDSIFGGHPDSSIVPTAVAYISFYLLGWSPVFWTAGYSMVVGRPQAAPPVSEEEAERFSRQSPIGKAWMKLQRMRASPTFKRIVSPPVLSCIVGMLVGITPWGKTLLLSKNAPLYPVLDALKSLGSAYLPAAILVLAGSLAKGQSASEPQSSGGALANGAFYRKVAAVMVSRFMVMPLVAAGLLISGSRVGAIPFDKLLWFVLLMEGCMPSAQNSVVILQMENEPRLAASMAKTLTAVYLLSAVPMAFLLSAILQFVQL